LARAAALGGNLYRQSALNDDDGAADGTTTYADEDVMRISQGSALSTGLAHETSNNYNHRTHPKSIALGAAAAAAYPDSQPTTSNQTVSIGVPFERTGSKRGLFSTPGRSLAHSRGAALIHSMRNLNLGKALGGGRGGNPSSSRQQLEWEQQWDEDEDSDDEEFVEENNLRMKADASVGPSNELPPSPPLHETLQTFEAHHVPAAAPAPALRAAVPPQQAPKQPPYQTMSVQAEDLLAKPLSDSLIDEGKPNVEMFLPMLRVLGKGSFGKVRAQHTCSKTW
jgi:hypothetical protein